MRRSLMLWLGGLILVELLIITIENHTCKAQTASFQDIESCIAFAADIVVVIFAVNGMMAFLGCDFMALHRQCFLRQLRAGQAPSVDEE